MEGISEDIIQRILSLPDVRTLERGDTTFYVVGSFAAIPEALRRELELRGMGIESQVMAEENGRLIDVSDAVQAVRNRTRGMGAVDDSRDVIIRVQLGAFRRKLSQNIFRDVPDLVTVKGDDGLTRYYTGSFTSIISIPQFDPIVNSIEELANSKTVKALLVRGSSTDEYFMVNFILNRKSLIKLYSLD